MNVTLLAACWLFSAVFLWLLSPKVRGRMVELTALLVVGQLVISSWLLGRCPWNWGAGEFRSLFLLLLSACWLAPLAMRRTLPELTTKAEIFGVANLSYITVFLVCMNFGFLRRVPAVSFSLNPQLFERGPLVWALAGGGSALVIVLLYLHVRRAFREHCGGWYLTGLLLPVILMAGVTLIWHQTHYLHLHHYLWSLILVFLFRYDAWWSRIPQAIVLGIFVDGVVTEGIIPIWYAYPQ